jgi:hypothetical protein
MKRMGQRAWKLFADVVVNCFQDAGIIKLGAFFDGSSAIWKHLSMFYRCKFLSPKIQAVGNVF